MVDIDDPFKPSDATILRPRPGAGRRGAPESAPPAQPAPMAGGRPGYPDAGPLPAAALGTGLNSLVQAASPLVILAGQLRGTLAAPDVRGLRQHAVDEIRRFEERARTAGVSPEVVGAARYALCTNLDEAVLSTPWGAQSEWAQQTLLVAFHRETFGGKKFFEMLDRISEDPARHIDLMELQYLCIALGFTGQYQVSDRGDARLAEVQHSTYRRIRDHRGTPVPELSPRWKGLEDRRNPLIRYVPWWVVGAAALAVLAITFVVYHTRLGGAAATVHAELAKVGLEDFNAPRPTAPFAGPTLKQLLAGEELRGALSVEESGGRTLITLLASDLFASGSATLHQTHHPVLQRVADALDRVPGRVLVVGHTDDQRLRSWRYRDNFELSRERAVSVVKILQVAMDSPGRVEWTGSGSSEPRYRPESLPENRARNRRVEIVHVRGS